MPIFLVLILILGGVVYAVPSFRNKFTGFIKQFGPKASEEVANPNVCGSGPGPDFESWWTGGIAQRDIPNALYVGDPTRPCGAAWPHTKYQIDRSNGVSLTALGGQQIKVKSTNGNTVNSVDLLDSSKCQILIPDPNTNNFISAGGSAGYESVNSLTLDSKPTDAPQSVVLIEPDDGNTWAKILRPQVFGLFKFTAVFSDRSLQKNEHENCDDTVDYTTITKTLTAVANYSGLSLKATAEIDNSNQDIPNNQITINTSDNTNNAQTFNLRRVMTSDFAMNSGAAQTKSLGDSDYYDGRFSKDSSNYAGELGKVKVKMTQIGNDPLPSDVILVDLNHNNQEIHLNTYYRPIQDLPSANYTNTDVMKFGADRIDENGNVVRKHMGVDVYASLGTDVKAIADGEIVAFQNFVNNSNIIIVKHTINGQAYYVGYGEVSPQSLQQAHISGTPSLDNPIHVAAGQVIGQVGANGRSEPMLHFEVYSQYPGSEVWVPNGSRPSWLVDPTTILDQIYQGNDNPIETINQELKFKVKANQGGHFNLTFSNTDDTGVNFAPTTMTVKVQQDEYSFQNLSICKQIQNGCSEVTGRPIESDETYKLKTKLVKMNNNVAVSLANKQVKIAMASGDGRVIAPGSEDDLFGDSSNTYTTDANGDLSIPFQNKTAGNLSLNLVYQSADQTLAQSNINLNLKPKYSLNLELMDVTSSDELLRQLVTDGNLYNEGIYQLKAKLTVANSNNPDYLNNKTIELNQTEGVGKLKNVDGSGDISSNITRLVTDSQGEAIIKFTKKEDLQNVASPWPVKLHLALTDTDVKKDLDLRISVVEARINICSTLELDPIVNQVASNLLNHTFMTALAAGGSCSTISLSPSAANANDAVTIDPSDKLNAILSYIQQHPRSTAPVNWPGVTLARATFDVSFLNIENLNLNVDNPLKDLHLEISLDNSLTPLILQLGSMAAAALDTQRQMHTEQGYQINIIKNMTLPIGLGFTNDGLSFSLDQVFFYNEHNQIIPQLRANIAYQFGILAVGNLSLSVGGHWTNVVTSGNGNYANYYLSYLIPGTNNLAIVYSRSLVDPSSQGFSLSWSVPIGGDNEVNGAVPIGNNSNNSNNNTSAPGNTLLNVPQILGFKIVNDINGRSAQANLKIDDFLKQLLQYQNIPSPFNNGSQDSQPQSPRSIFDQPSSSQPSSSNNNLDFSINQRAGDSQDLTVSDSNGRDISQPASDLSNTNQKNSPDLYITVKDSNDVLVVNQNDLRQGNVQNLVLEPQFNKTDQPIDPQLLISNAKQELDQKDAQDFCDPNLFNCGMYQNKDRIYPLVPQLPKDVSDLTAGEKSDYQKQYLGYVKEYNNTQSQEIGYIDGQFADNPLRTAEREKSKQEFYNNLQEDNLKSAQDNLDNFFAGKDASGNQLNSLKTEIENNVQGVIADRNGQEDYIQKNFTGADQQEELVNLGKKFDNNIQRIENKYTQQTGNAEEVRKIIDNQIVMGAEEVKPAIDNGGFLQKVWEKVINFMGIGQASAQDNTLKVEVTSPSGEATASYQAGSNLKLSISGLKNSEYYEVYLDNQFLAQGKKITNDFSFEVTIPQNIKTGDHQIVFVGSTSGEQAENNIEVTAVSTKNLSIYYLIIAGILSVALIILLFFKFAKRQS